MSIFSKKITVFIATLTLSFSQRGFAQDIHFSQFYETSILRNPALTGLYNGDYRMGLMYRNQWSSISAAFQTATASAEIKKQMGESQDYFGIGFIGFYDKTGSINLTTLSGSLAFSYNKMLNEEHSTLLSFGLMGGYLQRFYDPNKMTFGSQYNPGSGGYDPNNPSGEKLPNPKVGQMDLGFGINYTSNTGADNKTNYSFGIAGYHLTRPESNFYNDLAGVRQNFRWNVNLGINWLINETWSVQTQNNFMLQGKYNEIILGGLVGRKNDAAETENSIILYAGIMYRVSDALIPIVKLDYNQFTVAMSYDMNVSKLKAASNLRGGFEISMIKTGLLSDPQRGFNKTVCPRR